MKSESRIGEEQEKNIAAGLENRQDSLQVVKISVAVSIPYPVRLLIRY